MNGMSGSHRTWTAGLLFGLLALVAGACADDEGLRQSTLSTPSSEPTATATPSQTPVAEVTPLSLRNNPIYQRLDKRGPMVPAGPIAAEPYRVYTGDGDCLNVRPQPGTTFESDPRTCVPEGFLLWLYGEPLEVDGLSWRYALGEGWVADQYVRPDPFSSDILEDRAPEIVVVTFDGVEEYYSRVDTGGSVTPLATIPYTGTTRFTQGSSSHPPFAATQVHDTNRNAQGIVFTRLDTGEEFSVPDASFIKWSDDGKALVFLSSGERLAHVEPGNDPVVLGQVPSGASGYEWAPGGESVIVAAEGAAVYQFDLSAGGPATVLPRDMNRPFLGQLSISPDGRTIMSSPFLGPLQLISLDDGSVSEFQRANQRTDFGGRCGGASGNLSLWLDDETVIWHESYAEKGSNGITVGHLASGERSLVPFFTVQDIRRVDATTISFSTEEYVVGLPDADGNYTAEAFPVTWILDTLTGEARPITVGSTASRLGV